MHIWILAAAFAAGSAFASSSINENNLLDHRVESDREAEKRGIVKGFATATFFLGTNYIGHKMLSKLRRDQDAKVREAASEYETALKKFNRSVVESEELRTELTTRSIEVDDRKDELAKLTERTKEAKEELKELELKLKTRIEEKAFNRQKGNYVHLYEVRVSALQRRKKDLETMLTPHKEIGGFQRLDRLEKELKEATARLKEVLEESQKLSMTTTGSIEEALTLLRLREAERTVNLDQITRIEAQADLEIYKDEVVLRNRLGVLENDSTLVKAVRSGDDEALLKAVQRHHLATLGFDEEKRAVMLSVIKQEPLLGTEFSSGAIRASFEKAALTRSFDQFKEVFRSELEHRFKDHPQAEAAKRGFTDGQLQALYRFKDSNSDYRAGAGLPDQSMRKRLVDVSAILGSTPLETGEAYAYVKRPTFDSNVLEARARLNGLENEFFKKEDELKRSRQLRNLSASKVDLKKAGFEKARAQERMSKAALREVEEACDTVKGRINLGQAVQVVGVCGIAAELGFGVSEYFTESRSSMEGQKAQFQSEGKAKARLTPQKPMDDKNLLNQVLSEEVVSRDFKTSPSGPTGKEAKVFSAKVAK